MGIPASYRLRANSEFQKVRRAGQRVHCGPFIVHALFEGAEQGLPRLGLVASRRVGNAVVRNRGKRLFREIFRCHLDRLPAGSSFVVVLRSGYDRYDYAELEAQFIRALNRLGEKTDPQIEQ